MGFITSLYSDNTLIAVFDDSIVERYDECRSAYHQGNHDRDDRQFFDQRIRKITQLLNINYQMHL